MGKKVMWNEKESKIGGHEKGKKLRLGLRIEKFGMKERKMRGEIDNQG